MNLGNGRSRILRSQIHSRRRKNLWHASAFNVGGFFNAIEEKVRVNDLLYFRLWFHVPKSS